jgi:dienelactone hydrolase
MRALKAIGFAAACLVTTSALAVDSIAPRPVLPKYEFDKFEVEIAASRGYAAPVNIYMPKVAGSSRLPAVLLQFGAQGDKDVDYIVEIGEGLAKRGYVVMTMDMPGRGSRADQSPEPSGNEDLIRWYMDDYNMGLDYLASLVNVDPGRLSYAGTSLGAITGIPFCAADKRIKACISIVGGGSATSDLPEELDCVKAVSKIAPRATMLVNGTFDFVIPFNLANNLHTRVQQPFEKIWYPADHYLRGIDNEAFYDRMAVFMQTYARRR